MYRLHSKWFLICQIMKVLFIDLHLSINHTLLLVKFNWATEMGKTFLKINQIKLLLQQWLKQFEWKHHENNPNVLHLFFKNHKPKIKPTICFIYWWNCLCASIRRKVIWYAFYWNFFLWENWFKSNLKRMLFCNTIYMMMLTKKGSSLW